MLGSGCEQKSPYMKSSIETELFLFTKPQVIKLEKTTADFIKMNSDDFQTKISLAMKCSPGKSF